MFCIEILSYAQLGTAVFPKTRPFVLRGTLGFGAYMS